jgi:hypothetical protein
LLTNAQNHLALGQIERPVHVSYRPECIRFTRYLAIRSFT